jgi:hypothetical protein
VSNIFTTSVRVYAQPGRRIDEIEAQWITWMLLGPRGSYCVPVWTRCEPDGRYVDIQYGSGKSDTIVDFCDDQIGRGRYSTIWGRTIDDGHGLDIIWHHNVSTGPHTFCRYGFDEVRVQGPGDEPPVARDAPWRRQADGSWRLAVAGSYRTGNDRTDIGPNRGPVTEPIDPGPTGLATPTTPDWHGSPLTSIDPPWLAPLTDLNPGATLIEYYWQGRVVHRVRESESHRLEDRCADDWDNCLHPAFLIEVGATHLLAPEEVYERDRRDWDAFVGSFGTGW